MPSPSSPTVVCAVHYSGGGFCDGLRGPSSGGGGSSGGRSSSCVQASTKDVAVGKDAANRDDIRSNKAAKEIDRHDDRSDDEYYDVDDSSVAVSELEPLVERVASALEQHCRVRGGDLVRIVCQFRMARNIR